MKTVLGLIFSIICTFAEPVVLFDETTGKLLTYLPFANGPEFTNRNNALILDANPALLTPRKTAMTNVPANFFVQLWAFKVTNVTNITFRSQQELDAESAAVATAADTALRTIAKAPMTELNSEALVLRATVAALVDRINVLQAELNMAKTNPTVWRTQPIMQNVTLQQAKTAILSKIDDHSAD